MGSGTNFGTKPRLEDARESRSSVKQNVLVDVLREGNCQSPRTLRQKMTLDDLIMPNTVIVFVKYPTPGTVKTRLAKTSGNAEAAEFYRTCAEHVVQVASRYSPKLFRQFASSSDFPMLLASTNVCMTGFQMLHAWLPVHQPRLELQRRVVSETSMHGCVR